MASDPTQPGGRQPGLLGDEEDADIPPPPLGEATDPLDQETQSRLHRLSRRGRTLPTLLVLLALGAFAAIVWWAYRSANPPGSPGEVPVVEAEPGEEKVRPESEGGMDVPNQDVLIYNQLGQSGGEQGDVERLLPPPEEPLAPPAPPAVEAAPDTAALTPPPPPQDSAPAGEAAADAAPDAASDAPGAAGPEAVQPDTADTAPSAPAPQETVTEPAPAEAPEAESPAPAAAEPEPVPGPEPAPEPAPQVAAAGDGFRVQLAAVKSEADARAEWTRLQKAHADLLGGLQPTIQRADLGAQGVFYRIQGGPLASREAAAALCDRLKAKNQACLVVKP